MTLLQGLGIGILLCCGVAMAMLQFSHPQLTDTQRMVHFWPVFPMGLVGGLLVFFGGKEE